MAKIAIVGAGRVGTAAAKILLTITENEVALIDASEKALTDAFIACSEISRPELVEALSPVLPIETFAAVGFDQLQATLQSIKPDIVMCTTPFNVNIEVARITKMIGAHYIDFTEDNAVTAAIEALEITDKIFVPQTGLAPGLVNYIGLSLFDDLGTPKRLDLRVGALPQVSFGPEHYSITWSPEGLINEYIKPAFRKNQGEFEEVPPLDELESLIVDGTLYEGFTTAGGVGLIAAYEHIPSVEYKTLRYPGHRDAMQKIFAKVDNNFEDAVEYVQQVFTRTRDDVVVLTAVAVDTTGKSAAAGMHFYPSEALGLTALELTTAGIGVAIVELILNGSLPNGVLHSGQIPFQKLLHTAAARLVFDHLE